MFLTVWTMQQLQLAGERLKAVARGEEGATAVEYGIMVALIAVAIIVTVGLLGTQLNTMFGYVKDKIVVP